MNAGKLIAALLVFLEGFYLLLSLPWDDRRAEGTLGKITVKIFNGNQSVHFGVLYCIATL
jgi:hypothetical protein